MKTLLPSTLLKLFVLFFLSAFSYQNVNAQWVTIPDSNLVSWLNAHGFSQCLNGNQLDSTCTKVVTTTSMNIARANITDITGLQVFHSLKYLDISGNVIPIAKSFPSSLRTLIFNSNLVPWAQYFSGNFVFPDSLLHLEVAANAFYGGAPRFPNGIRYLSMGGNYIWWIPDFPDSLRVLSCGYCQFTGTFPSLPLLDTLWCNNNQLDSLAPLSPTLVDLNCSNNNLSELPALPAGLVRFDCSSNQIADLPTLPATLQAFDCHTNTLTDMPALPAPLVTLNCDTNQISGLPQLPSQLEKLYCGVNQLLALPSLPASLKYLYCYNNQISILPALPALLQDLNCDRNNITSILVLPSNLQSLNCSHNSVVQIPALPVSLRYLTAENCSLTSLPPLSGAINIRYVRVQYNQLTSIPELPDQGMSLDCRYNPNLTCLPQLKTLIDLYFDGTAVTCLPNYGSVYRSTPPLNSLPLCNIFNNNGCSVFWNISGKAYFDSNSNCIKDAADTSQRNVKVMLWSGGALLQTTFTGSEGFYSFDIDNPGVYEVSVDNSNVSIDVLCPSNNLLVNTITLVDSFKYSQDFSLVCKPGFDLAAWSMVSGRFRPWFNTVVDISAGDFTNFNNIHCAAGVSGTVQIVMTGPVKFVSANWLTPTLVSGNTITWNIPDFGAVHALTDFDITVRTDSNATLGSQACFTTSVTPTAVDHLPNNNTLTHCYAVLAPFDPNDKQVYPLDEVNPGEWLTYTIRFQNTGTAEARHVYVDDTLDANLDVASFQLLAYSHQPLVQIKDDAVRFNFPNIHLPDSNANEPASHGYVQYKIKPKDNLLLGTQIHNTAYIYFDFNSPVVTNTTTNTVAVTEISGAVVTETGTPIHGVTMTLTGFDDKSFRTENNGQYNLPVLKGGSYTVTPSKNNDVMTSNGVTTRDIVLIQRQILGIQPLASPYQIIAADVDGSGSVSILDIVLIRDVILSNAPTFPNGRLWDFVSSDYVFSDPQNPFPFVRTRTYDGISQSLSNQDFIGIKLGDVNISWNSNMLKSDAVGDVQFIINDYTVQPNDVISVPVKVRNFKGIAGYQFTISWDASVLSLIQVNNKELSGFYGDIRKNEGLLTTTWYDGAKNAVALNDDAVAFELKFRVIGDNGSFTKLKIGSAITQSEAYNDRLELLNISSTAGMVKVGEISIDESGEERMFSIYPVPAVNSVIISTNENNIGSFLTLTDLTGRKLATLQLQEVNHELSTMNLASGIYFVNVTNGNQTASRKLVVSR